MLTAPSVTMTVSQPAIFNDETTTVSWTTANASCVTLSVADGTIDLVPGKEMDPPMFSYSGTKYAGGGSWVMVVPPCNVGMSGQITYSPMHVLKGHGFENYSLTAEAGAEQPATASARFDVLAVPNFTGSAATPAHVAQIRSYLKEIFQKLSFDRCLVDNAALDTEVPAFKDQKLDRKSVSGRIADEIENGQNLTFQCEETEGPNNATSGWNSNNPNTIVLYAPVWQGDSNVSYARAVFEELLHKCGFNEYLEQWYSHGDVEAQTHQVAGSCHL